MIKYTLSLPQKELTEMLEDLKYDDIVYWDRVSGIEGDISSLKITEEKEVEGGNI